MQLSISKVLPCNGTNLNTNKRTYHHIAVLERVYKVNHHQVSELYALRWYGRTDLFIPNRHFKRLLPIFWCPMEQGDGLWGIHNYIFLRGLNLKIRRLVKMFKPKTLRDAYSLAKLQEVSNSMLTGSPNAQVSAITTTKNEANSSNVN